MKSLAFSLLLAILPLAARAAPADVPVLFRPVIKQAVVRAPALDAWRLWTTNEGFQSFFPASRAIETNIKLEPDGPYEIFIIPGAPEGRRGCDGCRILGYQEARMLSFTWTNRPDMAVRGHRTTVVLTFEPLGASETRVTLLQVGWGVGPDWNIAHDYFDQAWGHVLDAYKKRIESGR